MADPRIGRFLVVGGVLAAVVAVAVWKFSHEPPAASPSHPSAADDASIAEARSAARSEDGMTMGDDHTSPSRPDGGDVDAAQAAATGRAWVRPPVGPGEPWTGGAAVPRMGKPTAAVDLAWSWSAEGSGVGQLRVELIPRSDGQDLRLQVSPGAGVTALAEGAISFGAVTAGTAHPAMLRLQVAADRPWVTVLMQLDQRARSIRIPLGWDGYAEEAAARATAEPSPGVIEIEGQEILLPAKEAP